MKLVKIGGLPNAERVEAVVVSTAKESDLFKLIIPEMGANGIGPV